ncbi:hypothetical protein SEUCBS139899_009030 [Sporothrix eucalyptigena]|uniref:DUF6314 domain-containing protein n=1 Tax=Sporothrix eucalyptigena TaxID=1812306 RepID=A0ABP0C2B1_9PEZI
MADLKRTVCIVGAGPSGLAAAKNLLWDKRARSAGFRVTIVEAQPRIGGLWPSSPDDNAGLVHPLMLANQSRHTIQLSGLAWDDDAPVFPRAWQIGAYLERYYQRYLCGQQETGNLVLQLGRRVVKAEPIDGGKSGWHVWTQETGDDVVDAGVFDYLVVASGFFGSPSVPDNISTQDATNGVPTLHSSAYRNQDTLFGGKVPSSGKIIVAGGQFSGVEIAATIAGHLSNMENAPGGKPSTITVHHIVQLPFWVFPLYTSPAVVAASPPYLPFDLTSYNILKRPQPLTDTQGHISEETARTVHDIFETLLGTDQSDIHPALALPKESPVRDAPPYMAVSDTYLEHVRSGKITVSRGMLERVEGTQAKVTSSTGSYTVDDVAAVILATGFSAESSLSFFPDSVKEVLHFDSSDVRQPVALAFHSTHHPAVSRLAFVGFYRSPYWGVMEMQARLATALFTEESASQSWASSTPQWPRLGVALAEDRSIERTLALRADPDRTSQFPMGDYLYLMNSFGEALSIPRRSGAVKDDSVVMDIVTPMHYFDGDGYEGDENTAGQPTVDAQDNSHAIGFTRQTAVSGLKNHRFVARAVFRSLQGIWKLDRMLTSRLPSHPSGRFIGTAEFRLRESTKDGLLGSDTADEEYLYVEDGTFTASSGPSFRATRRYVWRYNERQDKITVWFARTDDASKADYLFHPLEFAPTEKGWKATAGHLCIDDFYDVHYQFSLKGVNLKSWTLKYGVRGPKKDYTISGSFRR